VDLGLGVGFCVGDWGEDDEQFLILISGKFGGYFGRAWWWD